ncbi:hypothetical protein NLI96_g7340 [Meripilus lineatus]|uniref:Uncharacterized protein n=1 Tax=Meripilus lineatus TaxID=2056292 RepID=A0AAD5YHC7_9APHY|nr:hypothetical protein NLI96_g7340 [Physisporinus lineatus]
MSRSSNLSLIPFRIPIDIDFLDWSTFPDSTPRPPFDERFDLVFAADVVYETEQVQWIKNCVEILLRIPESTQLVPSFLPRCPGPAHTCYRITSPRGSFSLRRRASWTPAKRGVIRTSPGDDIKRNPPVRSRCWGQGI